MYALVSLGLSSLFAQAGQSLRVPPDVAMIATAIIFIIIVAIWPAHHDRLF